MVAAQRVNVAKSRGGDVWHIEQRNIPRGSKVSFKISLRSPAFSTHHWKQSKFKLNAKQRRKRYFCAPLTVLPPQHSQISGRHVYKGYSCTCRAPHAHCSTDHTDHSIASDWLLDTLDFVPNKDGSPFRLLSLLFGSLPYFSSSCRFPFLPWLNHAHRGSLPFPFDLLFFFKFYCKTLV